MFEAICHQCGVVFHAQRRTAKFCDDACRKANHETTRRGTRKREPQNRSSSHSQARREDEFFDRHMRMCEAYYGLPPRDRPEYLLGLIAEAREGNQVRGGAVSSHGLERKITNRSWTRQDRPLVHHGLDREMSLAWPGGKGACRRPISRKWHAHVSVFRPFLGQFLLVYLQRIPVDIPAQSGIGYRPLEMLLSQGV